MHTSKDADLRHCPSQLLAASSMLLISGFFLLSSCCTLLTFSCILPTSLPDQSSKQCHLGRRVLILEDPDQNIHLRNLSLLLSANEEEALNLLFLGDTNRMISEVGQANSKHAAKLASSMT